MRQSIILFLLVLTFNNAFSQNERIQFILDSIVKEADLMYKHEKVAWESTDLLIAKKFDMINYGGYVVTLSSDSITITHLNQNMDESVARFTYVSGDLKNPVISSYKSSALTSSEKELQSVKFSILEQLYNDKLDVTIPLDYSPNFVLIKDGQFFRLYIIMGTTQSGVIPFGKDYLFIADSTGKIISWKKLHSTMIPIKTQTAQSQKVFASVHSHLPTTPYIPATDICTFRLYAPGCGMKTFTVFCTATKQYYQYNMDENKIEIIGQKLEQY